MSSPKSNGEPASAIALRDIAGYLDQKYEKGDLFVVKAYMMQNKETRLLNKQLGINTVNKQKK